MFGIFLQAMKRVLHLQWTLRADASNEMNNQHDINKFKLFNVHVSIKFCFVRKHQLKQLKTTVNLAHKQWQQIKQEVVCTSGAQIQDGHKTTTKSAIGKTA